MDETDAKNSEMESYEGLLVARSNHIESLSEPFSRGGESPLTLTMSTSNFNLEQAANILSSIRASFLLVDFHLEGVTVEKVLKTRDLVDLPVCLVGLVQPSTNEADAIAGAGLDRVYHLPLTPPILQRMKRELPTVILDTQNSWGKGAWNVAPDMIRKAAQTAGGEPWEQQTIGVWSPKGGVGKTFLATELAVALSNIGGRSCCIVDANMNGGHVKLRLGYNNHHPSRSIVSAANTYRLEGGPEVPTAVRSSLVDDVFISVGGQGDLRLLAGVDSMVEAQHEALATEAGYHFAQDMMKYLSRQFEFVIVDLGSSTNVGIHRGVLTQLDSVLIIAEPGLTSLNDSRMGANLLEHIGVPRSDIKLVVNKWLPDIGLSLRAASLNADLSVAGLVPFDATGNVTRAENEGISYMAKHASKTNLPAPTQKTMDGIVEIASRFYPPIGQAWKQRKSPFSGRKKGILRGLFAHGR